MSGRERILRYLGLTIVAVALAATATTFVVYARWGHLYGGFFGPWILLVGVGGALAVAMVGVLVRAAYGYPQSFRMTTGGWAFAGVAMLIGFAAVKSEAPLMYVLFGGMIAALMLSLTIARRIVSAVEIRRDLPDRVWQDQPVHFGYYLRNRRRRSGVLGLRVEEIAPEGVENVGGYCVHLPPQAAFLAGARFSARRRGPIALRTLRVSTVFPFGLVEAAVRREMPASVIVWPARGELPRQLFNRGAVESSRAVPSGVSGGQDEFFGLREYRPDDNPRWIHWRKSATRAMPVVREMARPVPEILWVIVDTRCDERDKPNVALREQRLRFAATAVDQAFTRGYQVALAVGTGDEAMILPPSGGRGQRRNVLDALACVEPNGRMGLNELVGHLSREQLRDAQVLIASDDADGGENLATLRAACRRLSVLDSPTMDEIYADWARPGDKGEEY